jgi:SAM-dependent methyltransferase
MMKKDSMTEITQQNKAYWDAHADLWDKTRTVVLPNLGHGLSENELQLFGDVAGKRLLEVCCGSGHSLKYHADRGAAELWGVDISHNQLAKAQAYAKEHGYTATLFCAPMEAEIDIPKDYFDIVYSIYGIGWTTDLDGTFAKIASYLKKDGVFIFSWHHTLNYCVAWDCSQRRIVLEDGKLVMHRSYFDESWFTMPVDGSEVKLCNRKISTYINALAKAGFTVERMEERRVESPIDDSDYAKKQSMLPMSVLFKARKL